MTAGWEYRLLSEIADHRLGKMLDKRKNKGDLHRYLRNVNVRWSSFDLSDLKEMRFSEDEQDKYLVEKGDLVVCEGGYPGRAAIWQEKTPIFFQKALHRIRFHEPSHASWFLYYLQHLDASGKLSRHFTGSGIQHLTRKALAKLEVPLPPLREQKRIVAILDKAFEAIAKAKENTEKNLVNAQGLLDSHLNRAFSRLGNDCPSEALEGLVERLTNGYVGPTRNIYQCSGVPYLLAKHVRSNRLAFDGKTFVTEDFNSKHKKSTLRKNDVLLVQSGHIGHSAVVPAEHDGHNCHAMIVITPKPKKLLGAFLSCYFNSPLMKRKFQQIRSGSTVPHLTCRAVKQLKIPVPSICTQERIAEETSQLRAQVRKLEEVLQNKMSCIEELRLQLLRSAFSGKLKERCATEWQKDRRKQPAGLAVSLNKTEIHAGILALAYLCHQAQAARKRHFGHVKGEKIAHMVEQLTHVDLGRVPIKDEYGPNDFERLQKVEGIAAEAGYFVFRKVKNRYVFNPGENIEKLTESIEKWFGEKLDQVTQVINLIAPMTTKQAEVFTTTYAAWNNLLIRGESCEADEIIYEARENWHESKLKIPRSKFAAAIDWISEQGIEPKGTGKLVEPKPPTKKNRKSRAVKKKKKKTVK